MFHLQNPNVLKTNIFKTYTLNLIEIKPRTDGLLQELLQASTAEVAENCVVLGYYLATSGYLLTTFQENLSVPYAASSGNLLSMFQDNISVPYAASSGNLLSTFQENLSVPYAASCGNLLTTFRDYLWVPFSGFKKSQRPIVYAETSARNYHYSLRNDPEERSSK